MLSDFRSPDRKAPRFRPCSVAIFNKKFCEDLRQEHPDLSLTDAEIKEIVFTANGLAWQTVVDKREGLELFEHLGYIFIGSCPRKKGSNPDYVMSAKLGKIVQHKNYESDQYIAKIFYTNNAKKYYLKHHNLWSFKAVREFRKMVGRTYPEHFTRYILVSSLKNASNKFRKVTNTERLVKAQKKLSTDYDPFEID